MAKIPSTNMPKPKSTKAPTTKNMPKKSGSIGKMVNMSSKPKPKGPVYVFPDGSKVGVKDLGKVKPTPKAKKPSPLPTISDKEYLRRQKEFIASQKKAKK